MTAPLWSTRSIDVTHEALRDAADGLVGPGDVLDLLRAQTGVPSLDVHDVRRVGVPRGGQQTDPRYSPVTSAFNDDVVPWQM